MQRDDHRPQAIPAAEHATPRAPPFVPAARTTLAQVEAALTKEVYRKLRNRIVKFFRYNTALPMNVDDAEDQASEVITRLWKGARAGHGWIDDPGPPFEAIAMTIADRRLMEIIELKMFNAPRVELDEETFDLRMTAPPDEEIAITLGPVLAGLPPPQARALALCAEGYKPHEAAELMNVTEDAYKSYLKRGRKHVSDAMDLTE